jgi:hypothetical protein
MAISAAPVNPGYRATRIAGSGGQLLSVTVTDVTMDASYPTGGEAITAADLGLSGVVAILSAQIKTTAAAGNAVDAVVDFTSPTAGVVKLNAAAAEVGNGSNVATLVVRVVAIGI